MKFYNLGSRRSLVNLLSDFIVSKLSPNDYLSQIEITDCVNFFVIGGKTEFEEIQDLTDLKNKFSEEYKNNFPNIKIDKINIIDLIEYGKKPDVFECRTFGEFYNSDRPIYHSEQMNLDLEDFSFNIFENSIKVYSNNCYDNPAIVNYTETSHLTSEFPHGYSIKNNRNKLYYSEYVAYNLFSVMGITKINLNWNPNSINLISDSFIENDHINSIMLDVFDFNINNFTKKIEGYNILEDILNPKKLKPWLLRDKTKELFIT